MSLPSALLDLGGVPHWDSICWSSSSREKTPERRELNVERCGKRRKDDSEQLSLTPPTPSYTVAADTPRCFFNPSQPVRPPAQVSTCHHSHDRLIPGPRYRGCRRVPLAPGSVSRLMPICCFTDVPQLPTRRTSLRKVKTFDGPNCSTGCQSPGLRDLAQPIQLGDTAQVERI